MSSSKPANIIKMPDRPATKAIDVAGKVWHHPNPAELYRFLESRNDLLKTIFANQP
jgi:hypothetical protein